MSDCQENKGNAMNRKILLAGFTVLILGLIVAGVGLTCLQQAAPGTDIIGTPSIPNILGPSEPYVLAAPLPDVNDSYPVYLTVPPRYQRRGDPAHRRSVRNIGEDRVHAVKW